MTTHRAVSMVVDGERPSAPITVVVFCRCGLVERVSVVHHCEGAHDIGRFTRALRAEHERGAWPVRVAAGVAADGGKVTP